MFQMPACACGFGYIKRFEVPRIPQNLVRRQEKKVVDEYDEEMSDDEGTEAPEEGESLSREDKKRIARHEVTELKSQVPVVQTVAAQSIQTGMVEDGDENTELDEDSNASNKQSLVSQSIHNPDERTQSQCMSFANYLKAQDVYGIELVRMWKGTCDPAVAAGGAPANQIGIHQSCATLLYDSPMKHCAPDR
eukprot:GEMP01089889.1.p1 GENE.GEMP01089889.1~~GEMP01089889.1.p1  ORF type:complete len:192 (+),score=34.09 GEMP01089889.1:162-737(+)